MNDKGGGTAVAIFSTILGWRPSLRACCFAWLIGDGAALEDGERETDDNRGRRFDLDGGSIGFGGACGARPKFSIGLIGRQAPNVRRADTTKLNDADRQRC